MRPAVNLLFILLMFSGCSRDELVPCMGDGPTGELCREYRFFNGNATGYISFDRPNDSVRVSEYYDTRSVLQKTVTERFAAGHLISVAERYGNGITNVQTLHYNELDSLSLIVYGANDSSLSISYVGGKRSEEVRTVGGNMMSYNQYRYYEDDGLLYRISTFDANDSLLLYRQFNYFSSVNDTHQRVGFFSGTHKLLGNRVFLFAPSGLLLSSEYREADATLVERKEYTYNSEGKLTEMQTLLRNNTTRSVYLYY